MARDKDKIDKRNKKIRKRFAELCAVRTKGGKAKFSYDYMIEKLGDDFFLSDFTIEQILKK